MSLQYRKKMNLKVPRLTRVGDENKQQDENPNITIDSSTGFEDLDSFWKKVRSPSGDTPESFSQRDNNLISGKDAKATKEGKSEITPAGQRNVYLPSFSRPKENESEHSVMSQFMTSLAQRKLGKHKNGSNSKNSRSDLFSPSAISTVSTATPSSVKLPDDFDTANDASLSINDNNTTPGQLSPIRKEETPTSVQTMETIYEHQSNLNANLNSKSAQIAKDRTNDSNQKDKPNLEKHQSPSTQIDVNDENTENHKNDDIDKKASPVEKGKSNQTLVSLHEKSKSKIDEHELNGAKDRIINKMDIDDGTQPEDLLTYDQNEFITQVEHYDHGYADNDNPDSINDGNINDESQSDGDNNDNNGSDDDKEGSGFQMSSTTNSAGTKPSDSSRKSSSQKNSSSSNADTMNSSTSSSSSNISKNSNGEGVVSSDAKKKSSSAEKKKRGRTKVTKIKNKLSSHDSDEESALDMEEESRKHKKQRPAKITPNATKNAFQTGIAGPREYKSIPASHFKEAYSSEEENDYTNGNLRRSRRAKFPPLEYWKNEKLIYHANNDYDDQILGDMPVVGAVVKALPTPYKKRKIETKSKQKKKSKKNEKYEPFAQKSSRASNESQSVYDDTELREKYEIIEGDVADIWDDDLGGTNQRKVVSKVSKMVSSVLPITRHRDPSESRVVGSASQAFNIPEANDTIPGWISGHLILPPKGIKDAEGVGLCSQVFNVQRCQPNSLEVSLADPDDSEYDPETAQRFLLGPGDFFHVPPNNVYRIENHSTSAEAVLFFTIIRPMSEK